MTDVKVTSEGVKIKTEDGTKAKIIPTTETGKFVAKAMSDIQETGMPTNDQLNEFGDLLSQLLEEEKKKSGDEKTENIIQHVQNVVEGVQDTVNTKNYDETLQKITKNIKEQGEELGKIQMKPVDFDDETENILVNLRRMVPMVASLAKSAVRDPEFRELLLALLDVARRNWNENKEVLKDKEGGSGFQKPQTSFQSGQTSFQSGQTGQTSFKSGQTSFQSGQPQTSFQSGQTSYQKPEGLTQTGHQQLQTEHKQPQTMNLPQSGLESGKPPLTTPSSYHPQTGQTSFQSGQTSHQPQYGQTSFQPQSGQTSFQSGQTSHLPQSGQTSFPSGQTSHLPQSGQTSFPSGQTSHLPQSGQTSFPSGQTSHLPQSGQTSFQSGQPSFQSGQTSFPSGQPQTSFQSGKTSQQPQTGLGNEPIYNLLREDIKDTSQTGFERTKEGIKEKMQDIDVNLTDEEREELTNRSINALLSIRNKPQFKTNFENLFVIYDEMLKIWEKISNNQELQAEYRKSTVILRDVRILVERSSNRSLSTWDSYLKEFQSILRDEKYMRVRDGIEAIVLDRNNKYNTFESVRAKIDEIQDNINKLNDQYGRIFDKLFNESYNILNGISNDPQISKVMEDVNKLALEIFTDEKGRPSPTVAIESITKIKDVFFPILTNNLKFLELPTIFVESDKYRYNLSDISLKTTDIFPDMLHIETDSNMDIDVKNNKRQGSFVLKIQIRPIKIDVEKMHFDFKKKTFIKYKDHGVINVHISDASMYFEFVINLEMDKIAKFEMRRVDTDLGDMKIDIIEAKHDILDKFITTLFMPVIKNNITREIDERLFDSLNNDLFGRINIGLEKAEIKRQQLTEEQQERYKLEKESKRLKERKEKQQEQVRLDEERSKKVVVETHEEKPTLLGKKVEEKREEKEVKEVGSRKNIS